MKRVVIIGGETHIGEITQLAGKELEIVGAVVRQDQQEHAAATRSGRAYGSRSNPVQSAHPPSATYAWPCV